MKLTIHTDGGSRGNPGPAATGVLIEGTEHNLRVELSKYIGVATNNDAEYTALLEALTKAKDLGGQELTCYLDSELAVRQLNGIYKVKNERILILWKKIKELEKSFMKVTYHHIPREKNKDADRLVNEALDNNRI